MTKAKRKKKTVPRVLKNVASRTAKDTRPRTVWTEHLPDGTTRIDRGDEPIVTTVIDNYDLWLRIDLWTLREATYLSFGINPSATCERVSSKMLFTDAEKLVMQAMRAKNLEWIANEGGTPLFEPAAFVSWACRKDWPVPSALRALLEPQSDSRSRGLRSEQLDKHAVRAMASYLWSLDCEQRMHTIARHKAIQQFCNGKQYKEKTIKVWIKDLYSIPKTKRAGRPRKAR